jgi:putative NADH-flavin reductase
VNLLILGASGGTGRLLVAQAIAAGHRVTAVSRHPGRIGTSHANLTISTGDVAGDPGVILKLLPGHDAVLSTLGNGSSLSPHALMARSSANVIPAMERLGPRRLVWLSSYGVGPDYDGATGMARLFFSTLLRGIYADKALGEAAVRGSGLEWTLVNPVMLTNDPAIPKYRALEGLRGVSGAKIPRANVAAFMLKCVSDTSMIGKRLILSP